MTQDQVEEQARQYFEEHPNETLTQITDTSTFQVHRCWNVAGKIEIESVSMDLLVGLVI